MKSAIPKQYNVLTLLLAGHNIDCFECDSSLDPRCGDPFNYTLTIQDMPPLEKCEGCCVKLVQNLGTPAKKIRWDFSLLLSSPKIVF